jgi:uncharacterized protein YcfL
MKTHILFTILTALFLTACASKEGRKVASSQEVHQEEVEYAKPDGNAGRDFSGQ